jgi:hypothetical protein
MIPITITAADLEALAGTLPLGSVGFERDPHAKGEHRIWLEPRVLDRLQALRGPGESYSESSSAQRKTTVARGIVASNAALQRS